MTRITREPALVAGAVTAILNTLVLLGVLDLDADQLGGINVAVAALLALMVRQSVTPTGDVAVARDPETGSLVAADAYTGAANGTPVDVDVAAA